MAFRKRSLNVFVYILLSCLAAYGQRSLNEGEPEFRVISLSSITTLYYDFDDELVVVNSGLGTFSPLYPIPQDRDLTFYREEPNPDPTKPPIKVTIAEAKIPSSEGPFLILLMDNTTGSGLEFNTLVIDHSLKAHPANQYRVFNFSERRMAVRLADHDMLLDSGKTGTVAYPDGRKAWLKVAAENDKEGWLVVTSSSHAVGADSRTTIFLIDIPPSERDPDPLGIIVRKMREQIVEDEFGVKHVQ